LPVLEKWSRTVGGRCKIWRSVCDPGFSKGDTLVQVAYRAVLEQKGERERVQTIEGAGSKILRWGFLVAVRKDTVRFKRGVDDLLSKMSLGRTSRRSTAEWNWK
jgi:hypothetical protein